MLSLLSLIRDISTVIVSRLERKYDILPAVSRVKGGTSCSAIISTIKAVMSGQIRRFVRFKR